MAEDIIFCAKTGRRIFDGNVVSLSRFDAKPVPVPAEDEAKPLPVEVGLVPDNDDI